MKKELIEYLNDLLNCHYNSDTKIDSAEILESKLSRVIYILKLNSPKSNNAFVLHFRKRSVDKKADFRAMKLAESHGVLTPRLVYYELTGENPFETPFFIQEFITAKKLLERKDWFKKNTGNLFKNFEKLHRIKTTEPVIPDLKNLKKYKRECLAKLRDNQIIDVGLLERMFESVMDLYSTIDFSLVQPSMLHGDLHYSNILVTEDNNFYLIDWEMASYGDYCKDLAYFKARALDYMYRDKGDSSSIDIFKSCLHYYKSAFNDSSIEERMLFYLPTQYLELIWRCSIPKISQQWMPFYFNKLNDYIFKKKKNKGVKNGSKPRNI